ncbi:acyl-CoA dehydrogenase/oxidase C-terminal [Jimgerdemannia flammicorona]|uniref:Acyl-coenzyme A oxidase n=1 Tax=Jimgerdemannia flammicorona TaxID=994334 RepID=A0A433CX86_9FUNG|nr:acyl-CoA dehydrogenase/oxidase C-terminal [Jimgerdemannia flammicorona]
MVSKQCCLVNYSTYLSTHVTELGHGSNLKALETTATLDTTSDEWVINSPHVSSGKYWIGALGKLATHAIVQAKLIIAGRDHGTHSFLVPIRSLADHRTFPDVEIHDIGPKVGNNPIDNGFALFTNYRVPRDHMLMRYASVSRRGVYQTPLHDKLVYATLTKVRVDLVEQSAVSLSRAVTIAIRYSAVRRQGAGMAAGGRRLAIEKQILDYTSVQYRLLPLLVQTWAMTLTAEWMREMYGKLINELAEGKVDMLADVHAYSSGLKSYTTSIAADGIEEARKCIGGHGYSMFSGIADFYNTFRSSNAVEGENWLLTQQTARYLLKLHAQTLRKPTLTSHLTNTTLYLTLLTDPRAFAAQHCPAITSTDLLDPTVQLGILAHNAARQVSILAAMQSATPTLTTADLNIECLRVSRAHCQHILAHNFVSRVTAARSSREIGAPALQTLEDMSSLYALHCVEENLGEHLESRYLSPEQVALVRQAVKTLMARIRPHAVTLVDSFGWQDAFLNSALGSYDGRAYERLVEWLKDEPLNTEAGMDEMGVVRGYKEYIMPIVKGECGRWTEKRTEERTGVKVVARL